jgi:phosphoenolpyruvate carboxykinase (GTP)
VPTPDALDVTGLDLDAATIERLVSVDVETWREEVPQIEEHYAFIGKALPADLRDELAELEKRLAAG